MSELSGETTGGAAAAPDETGPAAPDPDLMGSIAFPGGKFDLGNGDDSCHGIDPSMVRSGCECSIANRSG